MPLPPGFQPASVRSFFDRSRLNSAMKGRICSREEAPGASGWMKPYETSACPFMTNCTISCRLTTCATARRTRASLKISFSMLKPMWLEDSRATDVLRRHIDVEIDAARLELGRAGCILGKGAEHDAVDPWRSRVVVGGGAPRIGIVADQLHAIVLGPFLELERPGAAYARRDDAVVLSVLGHVLGVGNARVGPFRLAHVVEEDQRRVLEPADERGVVDDLRLGEARHLGPRGKGLLGIDPAIEVVLHVLRGEGRPAVKLDALL